MISLLKKLKRKFEDRRLIRKLPARFLTWSDYYKFLQDEIPNLENYTGLKIMRYLASDNKVYSFNVNYIKKRIRQEVKTGFKKLIN